MKIERAVVNHEERNYFNDYDELRTDTILAPSDDIIRWAIDKLARNYKRHGKTDCMFVFYHDNTSHQLMYDFDPAEEFDPKSSQRVLVLKHYTNSTTGSWDKKEVVTVAEAKARILK